MRVHVGCEMHSQLPVRLALTPDEFLRAGCHHAQRLTGTRPEYFESRAHGCTGDPGLFIVARAHVAVFHGGLDG